jgi:C4-dicarboxylate-specific signal transduction histidine kinase
LGAGRPDLEEARQALRRIVENGNRAGEVIGRIRALIKKAPPRKDAVAINDAILEVAALTHGEAAKNGVSVQTQLVEGLPTIEGDRVQLQQVILNLIVNAIEAMSATNEAPRELLISTGRTEPDGVLVAVRDSGPGLASAALERLFDPFCTTKANGMGAGAVDLPLDHRSTRRTIVGGAKPAPWRYLSVLAVSRGALVHRSAASASRPPAMIS